MKRNTAEIRREGRKGFEEEKQGGRIKEKKGNQGRESWTPSGWRLAHGRRGRRFICLSRNVLHVSS